MLPRSALLLVLVSILGMTAASSAAEDAEALFVRRVLPLFEEKCLACHGRDEKKIKGGLDMRTRAGLLKGGDSEQASLVPGQPGHSPLLLSIGRRHDDWEPMPPKENDKLSEDQIGWVRAWVLGGAPWPEETRRQEIAARHAEKWSAEDGVLVRTSGGLAPDWTNRRYKHADLWAYRPLRKPAVPGLRSANSGPRNPIDAFLAARLPADAVPAPPADRRTLLRRATFDLLGLPPTPEEVATFLADPAPDDAAFAKVVERLLGSPHYGEKWAQHWLDVVRYADSSGFANDYARGNAWRYRDYVVRALNSDKPYDQFIREQIAGDEIDERDPEKLIATGFLRMGPWELTGMEVPKIARQRFLDDVTNSVGETFLAHSLQCARCHDHKFDPVPTRDYYALQAVFATTQLSERPAPFAPEENVAGFEERKYLQARRGHYLAILERLDAKSLAAAPDWFAKNGRDPARWAGAVAEARAQPAAKARREFVGVFEGARARLQKQGVAENEYPPKLHGFSPEDYGHERIARKGLERLKWDLDRYEPVALAVYAGRTPEVKNVAAPQRPPADRMQAGELEKTVILTGGDPFAPGAPVFPAVLSAATPDAPALPAAITGRRRALADWIASSQNPLTARVMVNRIWLWHFGRAIAGNPNNFGGTGKKPTHPELLDWLAATFIEQGWSVKAMHRAIMASKAYRRGSSATAPAPPEDYAAFPPRRLSAEELRDAMLHVTGELNPARGGIPVRPEMNLEAALQPRQVMGTFAEAWQPSPLPAQRHRRSIYALKIRGQLDPFYEVFNAPSPDLSCEGRDASTVTPQVFSLFNSAASYQRALAFATRLQREVRGREQIIARAFQLAAQRAPRPPELAAARAHWDAMTARHGGLAFQKAPPPREVVREAVEENTGEKFRFTEPLEAAADFVPDLHPADASPETRGLAEVCLVLLNSNEFAYVY